MDDVTKVQSQVAKGDSSQPEGGAPIRIVETQTGADGQVRFNLPVSQDNVASVEVVDLDMLVVTRSGERFLLPQAALLATVSPDKTIIKFSNGAFEPASEELKRVGVVKQVEGGSYRIQASEVKPVQGIRDKDGSDFALSKENGDSAAQEQIASLQAQLQALQSASLSQDQPQQTHMADRTFTADPVTNKLVSPTLSAPGSANTSTHTADYTTPPSPSVSDLRADRQLFSTEVGKLDGVLPSSGASSFKLVEARSMLASSPVAVQATGTAVGPNSSTTDVANPNRHVASADLILPGLANAATVELKLTNPGAALPPDFTINGTPVTGTTVITSVVGSTSLSGQTVNDTRINLTWTVADDSTTVTPLNFALAVKFFDAEGTPLAEGAAPINFHYSDIRDTADTYNQDANGHYILELSAKGWSYDVNGTTGNDVIGGGDGHDILRGGAGNDTLHGHWGDDTLIGGSGSDQLDGGTGNNTASYASSASAVSAYLDGLKGTNAGGDVIGDTFVNIQNLIGSAYNDLLLGDTQANVLNGGLGNDTLEGGAGADTLIGGGGTDTASYENAGGAGVIASLANPSANQGDAEHDVYQGIANLRGSVGKDMLTGDAAANLLEGLGGDDTLEGGQGADTLDGGAGNNMASYEGAAYTRVTSDGTKIGIVASLADTSLNTGDAQGDVYLNHSIQGLKGSAYNDLLVGNGDANTLEGGAGDDTLIGGASADLLKGGDGTDTASYDIPSATMGVTARLDNDSLNLNDALGDKYESIENLIGTKFADKLAGDGQKNVINGGEGDDTLIGGTGGGDVLQGGGGTDTVTYEEARTGVSAYLATADQAQNAGAAAGDTYQDVENLVGSSHDDYLQGDAAANRLTGGAGNDTLAGGLGADTLDGGDGTDTVSYANASARVELSLASGGSGGEATGDVFANVENAIGSAFADKISGTAGNNVLEGGAGDDTLDGAGGSDTLIGGAGNDTLSDTGSGTHTYIGGSDTDTVSYETVSTAVHVDLSSTQGNTNGAGSTEIFSSIENLIGGTGNDYLAGDSNANKIQGGAGADTLIGGDGNDALLGGDGNDILKGGAGADQLSGGNGVDTASYADSSTGVFIDLANATLGQGRGTGDAAGDTFDAIEVIEGSAYSDYIYAGAPASSSSTLFYRGDGHAGSIDLAGSLISGDTVDFSGSNAAVSVDLAVNTSSSQTATGGWAAGAYFNGIENLVGSSGADTLRGDANANVLSGGGNADILFGAAGDDVLNGGDGDDTLEGGAGVDVLNGGAGINTSSYANAAAGVKASLGTPGTNSGDAAGDTYSNIQNLLGSGYNDTLEGDGAANALSGGAGDDLLYVSLGIDTLDGGTGSNTADFSRVSVSSGVTVDLRVATAQSFGGGVSAQVTLTNIQNLNGSNFADSLVGDVNDNMLDGGQGDDTLVGGGGADVFVGGTGTDTVSYASASAPLTIDVMNLVKGQGRGTGDATGDVISYGNVEKVLATSGDDLFYSGGRTGSLQMDGGSGTDTVSYLHAAGPVVANLTAVGTGSASGDSYVNVENLVGSSFNDSLTGSDLSNNAIEGGAGDDVLYVTLGTDTLTGGDDSDTADFSLLVNPVTINLSLATAQALGSGNTVILQTIENLTGTSGTDFLRGDGGGNILKGGAGNDTLDGGDGNDTLIGGANNDSLIGGNGLLDTVDYSYVTSAITIDLGNGTLGAAPHATGDAAGDVIDQSVEIVKGSATASNTFHGRTTAETDYGGTANDLFYSSAGGDTYHGGGGNDTVNYSGSGAAVKIDLANQANNSGGDALGDVLDAITTIVGTSGNDTMIGGSAGENFQGGNGNDSLAGNDGNDTLDGGAGNDTLDGGAGNDLIYAGVGDTATGGTGSDTIVMSMPQSSDSFSVAGGGGGTDTLRFEASGLLDMTAVFAANNAKYQGFDVLDLSQSSVSQVKVSYSAVQALVDQGTSSSLTIRLQTGDQYSFDYSDGANQSNMVFGDNSAIFKDASNVTLATVNFQYV